MCPLFLPSRALVGGTCRSLGRGFCSSSSRAATVPNRTALITGAGQGIGRAIALRLASDGFNICVNDLPSNAEGTEAVANEVRALGREAITSFCDVTKMSEVEEAVRKSTENLGPLNVLVANAGIVQINPVLNVAEEEMKQIFGVNVFGVINSNIAAGKQFIKQGKGGKIINAASIRSYTSRPNLSLYCATKAAVRSLTQGFALELAKHNVTVNAYAPGIIDTKLWEKIDTELAKINGLAPRENWKAQVKNIALGRNGVPKDVSNLVSFLAGPDSDYITDCRWRNSICLKV
ncbi:NAD-P-binding protein [Marasmius fiardii PR-910]|nr:NAD-P-binding protein [Marasmius fiardii PR-910]